MRATARNLLGPSLLVAIFIVTGCQSHPTSKVSANTTTPNNDPDESFKRNAIFWTAGLVSVLDTAKPNVNESVLDQAVTDFFDAMNEQDFQRRFDKLSLPREVKVELWDLRYGTICKAMAVAPADYVPPPDSPQRLLDPLAVDKSNRAAVSAAWDAYYSARDQQDLQSRLEKIPLNKETKAALWNMKYGRRGTAQSFDAYYKTVGDCWNHAPDAATQIAAAKRLLALDSAEIASLRENLEMAQAEINDGKTQLSNANSKLNATRGAFAGAIESELMQGKETADTVSALQSRLFLLSTQYTNLQNQYEILQRQYNLLLTQRPTGFPRALDCGPVSADGSFDCIPGPH